MKQWIEDLSHQKVSVGPFDNLLWRTDHGVLHLIFGVVTENRLFHAILSLIEIMVQSVSWLVHQQEFNIIRVIIIFFVQSGLVVFDVVSKFTVREED